MEQQTKTEPRLFYSRIANLQINTGPGERVIEGGQSKVIPAPIIEFRPMGQEHWGQLMTSDPVIHAFLDSRIAKAAAQDHKSDVLTLEQWVSETTPTELKLKAANQEHDRLLTERNSLAELVEKLQAEANARGKKVA